MDGSFSEDSQMIAGLDSTILYLSVSGLSHEYHSVLAPPPLKSPFLRQSRELNNFYKRKQIRLKVFINQNSLFLIIIDVSSEAWIIVKLLLKLLQEIKDRLGNGLQNKASSMTARSDLGCLVLVLSLWDSQRETNIEFWFRRMMLKYLLGHIFASRTADEC